MTTSSLSILDTTKKTLGVAEDVTVFDDELTTHINSAFGELHQLGVGPTHGFEIVDSDATWHDFMGEDLPFALVKDFIHLRVKLRFDPPANSWTLTALKDQLDEVTWRMHIVREDRIDPATEDALVGAPNGVYILDGGSASE